MKDGILKWGVIVLCLWVIAFSTGSLWADGWLYRIKQPVEVTRVKADAVTLRFDRVARIGMNGYCSRDLICSNLGVHLSDDPCVIEPGHRVFFWSYPLPEIVEGTCTIRGTAEYEPLGKIGPKLTYCWESEEFDLAK